jgi:ribose 5-phosphate isomerase B
MVIGIGSDLAGFNLKNVVISYLKDAGHDVKDYGTYDLSSVDYPDFGLAVAEAVCRSECEKGIIICGTGIGISIAANKVPGIRAALCTDTYMARMSIEHNDANILSLGARVTGEGSALEIIGVWLKSQFSGGKHEIRVDKINKIENYIKQTED